MLSRALGTSFILASLLAFTACHRPADFLYVVPPPQPQGYSFDGDATIEGVISNALDGSPLSGVTIDLRADNDLSPIIATTQSDAQGKYIFNNLHVGNFDLDFTDAGFDSILGVNAQTTPQGVTIINETMAPVLPDGEFRIVLTWCGPTSGAVEDIDSYLHIPGESNSHPIGFDNPNDGMGSNLDHDDTTWYGPETISITNLLPGTYIYYINNYNVRGNTQALGQSSAIVHVYKGSTLARVYTIPAGTGITYELFHIVNGTIQDVQQYNDNLYVY